MADPTGVLINIALQAAIRLAIAALTPKVTNKGPRLEDLTLTTSTYGDDIALGYGTTILSGNVIWGKDLEEVKKKKDISKGSLFSPGVNVTYTYFATFAVGLCRREIEQVIRIYADGKIIYDETIDPAEGNDIMEDLDFTVYPGTRDQLPDPLIEADVGTEECPAYRGIAYIVFNRLPLKNFGNRVPSLRFVINFKRGDAPTYSYGFDSGNGAYAGSGGSRIDYDPVNETIYALEDNQDGDQVLWAFDAFSGQTLSSRVTEGGLVSPIFDVNRTGDIRAGRGSPYLLVSADEDGSDTRYAMISKESLTEVGRTDRFDGGAGDPDSYAQQATNPDTGEDTGMPFVNGNRNIEIITVNDPDAIGTAAASGSFPPTHYAVFVGTNSFTGGGEAGIGICEMTPSGFNLIYGNQDIKDDIAAPILRSFCDGASIVKGPESRDVAYFFVTAGEGNSINAIGQTGPYHLLSFEIPKTGALAAATGTAAGTGNPTIRISRDDGGDGNHYLWYDPVRDILVWAIDGASPATRAYSLSTFNVSPGRGGNQTISLTPVEIWQKEALIRGSETSSAWYDYSNPYIYSINDDNELQQYDIETGDEYEPFDVSKSYPLGDNLEYGSPDTVFWQDDGRIFDKSEGIFYFYPTSQRVSESLDTVVSDIVGRSKLTAADIDVSDLASENVRGYAISRSLDYRNALEPLMNAFNFYGVEKDGKLVFKLHTSASDLTIPEDDLVRVPNANVFEEARGQELETPRAVYITHLDPDEDDNKMVQGARRISLPANTMNSVGEQSVELPLYLTADEGALLAERLLYESWVQRETLRFRLPQRYLRLLPNDTVTVTAEGRTETLRLNRVSVGANLEVEIEGVLVDSDIYIQNFRGVTPPGSPNWNQGGLLANYTRAITGWLLDMPLLRDTDLSGNRTSALLYTAAARSLLGARRVYPGAGIALAIDGAVYDVRAAIPEEAPWGVLRTQVPDLPSEFWNGVQAVSLDVTPIVRADQFTSTTQSDMIQFDVNTAALYRTDTQTVEIIGFETVTQLDNGDIRLTNLLRGKRGTDTFAWDYPDPAALDASSPQVYLILLDPEWVEGFTEPLSSDGVTAPYQIFPLHRPEFIAKEETVTVNLRSLQPYEPTHIQLVSESSEFEIQWTRRTRTGGGLISGAPSGEVPLSEDTESYSVDIVVEGTDPVDGFTEAGTDYTVVRTLSAIAPAVEYTSAQMTADGYDAARVEAGLDPILVRVFQVSSQVGRGMSKVRQLYLEDI